MYGNYDYPQWAKAENMEMSKPLCELWTYSDRTEQGRSAIQRKLAIAVRTKISEGLYRLADSISVNDMNKRVEYE